MIRRIATVPIHLYRRLISPLIRPRCKYFPSCSEYALTAVREFGVVKGTILAGARLLRCNPWSHGGVDHVHQQRMFRS